ncbi:TVP38/TMEM64 family protein [Corynebacterium coyleae]|uniref:TVP38/TMEM64 family protein n=1 Tax=Corynebacterium coyleae TaxID=53374 RepID=UPI00254B0917|nr:TVP38/TMEM64 family protein [Corynebacterium coyleae]MDK8799217.1 TVP38/TMEM64 family protein [Corynebacterium coyleae]
MPKISGAARNKLVLAALIVVFIAGWVFLDVPPLSTLRTWADTLGPWFPVAFWLLYILITQFPIPRTVMTVSAGILFGSVQGILIAITATTVSAVISLLIVRTLLRDWVEPRPTHPAVEQINRRLEERGWLAIFSLRLIAAVPFSVLNYAAALTRVPVLPFAIATFAGSLPGTVLVTIFGDTLTGEANPVVIAVMAVLAVIGLSGLILDARLPARK